LQHVIHPGDSGHTQEAPNGSIVNYGQGNGEDTAEEIAENSTVRQSSENVMAGDIDPVGQGHDGVQSQGIGPGCDAHALIQKQGFDHIIEERHGKSGKEKRIGNPGPADVIVPAQEGGSAPPSAPEHRLDDVAQAGDSKPDKGPEIGQQPPVLGQGKGCKCRDEPDDDFEYVFYSGIEISQWNG